MAKRYIIEGEWFGRTVHRTVHAGNRKALRAWAEKTCGILYGDGSTLDLSVRDCEPRERVVDIKGYVELISDCAYYDVASVDGVNEARSRARALAKTGGAS